MSKWKRLLALARYRGEDVDAYLELAQYAEDATDQQRQKAAELRQKWQEYMESEFPIPATVRKR